MLLMLKTHYIIENFSSFQREAEQFMRYRYVISFIKL
jgi:hypothetical protein